MKKYILSICFSTILFTLYAQQSGNSRQFYVGINGGYNTKFNSTRGFDLASIIPVIPIPTVNINNDHFESVPFSYGQGINVGINIGYMFTANIGVELAADYMMGSASKYKYNLSTEIRESEISAKMIQLIPQVVFSTGGEKLSAFVKVGALIGLNGEMLIRQDAKVSANHLETELILNKGLAVGYRGAGGVEFYLSDKLKLFSEITFKGLTYSPEKGELIKADRNGVDELSSVPEYMKKYKFAKEADMSGSSITDEYIMTDIYYPLNSMGLNIGIKILL